MRVVDNWWRESRRNCSCGRQSKITILAGFAIAIASADPALAAEPEYLVADEVMTGVEIESPLDHSFEEPALFWRYRDSRESTPPIWKDSTLDTNIRSYWLRRDVDGATTSEALALGGEVLWRSGWYRDFASIRAAAYTSQPIYAPDERGGNGLLQPGQEGYAVLGKLSLQLQLKESRISLYRGELNTPFANKNDIRMTPFLFENYTLVSSDIPNVDILASVVTAYKPWTSTKFVSLLSDISPSTDSDMYIAGTRYRFGEDDSVGAIYYRIPDYLEITYAEAQIDTSIAGQAVNIAGQYIHQNSIGDEVGGAVRNDVAGLKLESSFGNMAWTLAWHRVFGDQVRADFASYPGYNFLLLRAFNRADEESFRLGLDYSFSNQIEGLSAIVNLAWGDRPSPAEDEREFDITIRYQFDNRFLQMTNLQLRYARVWTSEDSSAAVQDLRFIVNYQLPFF